MFWIFLFGALVRILSAPLAEHGDIINYLWWSKDLVSEGLLGFYGRSIDNAMPPTYPPVTTYVFYFVGQLHRLIWEVSWFINHRVPVFPSNFIFWLESVRGWYFVLKIPSILSDLGIAWVIYLLVKKIVSRSRARLACTLFLFSLPFWYNSSVWGQTDSIYGFFLIVSVYLLVTRRVVLSGLFYLVSVLTKPTAFFVLPALGIWWLKLAGVKRFVVTLILGVVAVYLLYFPFHPEGTLGWAIGFFVKGLGGELDYMVANAFNIWGFLFGFDNRADIGLVGYIPYVVFIIPVVWWSLKAKSDDYTKQIYLLALSAFSAFMFLPRMHERYFYLALLLMVVLVGLKKEFWKLYIAIAGIHFMNLYHFWWVPRVGLLVNLLSNYVVEKILILSNIGLYLRYYRNEK